MLPLSEQDVILDFDPGIDRVRFSGGAASGMSDLTIVGVRGGVLIAHEGGTVKLEGIFADDLSRSDFLF